MIPVLLAAIFIIVSVIFFLVSLQYAVIKISYYSMPQEQTFDEYLESVCKAFIYQDALTKY